MKLLVVMKRHGIHKDMVMLDFGRQVRLFGSLSKLGYNVDFFCPDYKTKERKKFERSKSRFYVEPYSLPSHFSFVRRLEEIIRVGGYDAVVGSTDPLFCAIAHRAARRNSKMFFYEMQDYFGSYATGKNPLVAWLDSKAVQDADLVMCVSDSLRERVERSRKGPTITIQNGYDPSEFGNVTKEKARSLLNLPQGKIIIYAGEISKVKGGDILLEAFRIVRTSHPDASLLLSGPLVGGIKIEQGGVIYEPYPKRKDLLLALAASDIGVLPNRRSDFAIYCFPYKIVEYMAAGLQIVATRLGDMEKLLHSKKYSLCEPGNAKDLALKLSGMLLMNGKTRYPSLRSLTWERLAKKIDKGIKKVARFR